MAKIGLPRDPSDGHTAIQGFAPNPSMCQVPVTINAGATATVSGTADMTVLAFNPSGPVQVILNDQTTKYMTFEAGVISLIPLTMAVTSVKLKNPGSTAITVEIWGA